MRTRLGLLAVLCSSACSSHGVAGDGSVSACRELDVGLDIAVDYLHGICASIDDVSSIQLTVSLGSRTLTRGDAFYMSRERFVFAWPGDVESGTSAAIDLVATVQGD